MIMPGHYSMDIIIFKSLPQHCVRYNDGGPVIGGVNGGNMGLYITPGCLHLPAAGEGNTGQAVFSGMKERRQGSVGGR